MISIPIETAPAAIGAASFLLYKVVTYMLQAPPAQDKTSLIDEAADEQADYPIPEPAPEPDDVAVPLEPDARSSTRIGLLRHSILVIACLATIYCLQDMPLDSSTGARIDPHKLKAEVFDPHMKGDMELAHATPSNEINDAAAAQVGEVQVAATTGAETEAALVAFKEVPVSEAPLTVPVARLVVGEGTDMEHMRSAYYGTLMIGSPPQPLTVVFDTGSGQVIVPSAYCNSPTCRSKSRYRRSASHTGVDVNFDGSRAPPGKPRDSMNVNFGTGEVGGVVVEDIVCMKDTGRTMSFNQTAAIIEKNEKGLDPGCVKMRFVAATRLSEDPFMDFTFDGIVGLGMDGLSQNRHFNFLQAIGDHLRGLGSATPSTFGVFLASSRSETSEMAFGGWTSSHLLEPLSWGGIHDPEAGHWIIPMHGVRVNGKLLDICKDGTCRAAVDTGTSLLSMPSEAFAPIFEGIRHATPLTGHCVGTGPLLQIDVGHFTIVLGPREYSQIRENRNKAPKKLKFKEGPVAQTTTRSDLRCFPILMAMDFPEPLGPKLFILGEPVLRKYYTVYDAQRQQVGIARAAHRQGPNRDELLLQVPGVDGPRKGGRSNPTMFDVFRWRVAVRQLQWRL